jgi:hypothetical protein
MIANLNDIVGETIQPFLKSIGFKKKGLQWNRDRGDFVDVLTVQEAKHSTSAKQVFTLNLGVAVKSCHEAVWQKLLSSSVSEADCPVRLRLGDLIQGKPFGDANDQWWEVEGGTQSAQLIGEQIVDALKDMGIPFLERFETFGAVADHLKKVRGWQAKNPLALIYRAFAEWKNGDGDGALDTLTAVKGKAWEAKAAAVREMIINTPTPDSPPTPRG